MVPSVECGYLLSTKPPEAKTDQLYLLLLRRSFNERVELIVEHEQGSGRERALAMASEERELADVFRRAEIDYEARLSSQVTL